MVLPSLVLLASLVTVGFAAPSAVNDGVDGVITAFDKIVTCANTVGDDLNGYPGTASVRFYFILFYFLCVCLATNPLFSFPPPS